MRSDIVKTIGKQAINLPRKLVTNSRGEFYEALLR